MKTKRAIKGIELVFENVQVQFIPVEYINYLGLGKISESIIRTWGWEEELETIKSCEDFTITLSHAMQNMKFDYFEGDIALDNNETVFERITKYQDLVSVTLKYKDDTEEEIYIPWEYKDGDDETNGLLTFEYCKNGDLTIEAKRA